MLMTSFEEAIAAIEVSSQLGRRYSVLKLMGIKLAKNCFVFFFADLHFIGHLFQNLMKCATKSILQKTLGKRFGKINLTYKSKIKHSKATHFCIVYASTHILTYPILGTT